MPGSLSATFCTNGSVLWSWCVNKVGDSEVIVHMGFGLGHTVGNVFSDDIDERGY